MTLAPDPEKLCAGIADVAAKPTDRNSSRLQFPRVGDVAAGHGTKLRVRHRRHRYRTSVQGVELDFEGRSFFVDMHHRSDVARFEFFLG